MIVNCAIRARSRAVARVYPRRALYLWVHDRIEPGSSRARWFTAAAAELRRLQPDIMCVSEYQRASGRGDRGAPAGLRAHRGAQDLQPGG